MARSPLTLSESDSIYGFHNYDTILSHLTSGKAGGLNILAPQRGSKQKPKTLVAVTPAKAGVQSFS